MLSFGPILLWSDDTQFCSQPDRNHHLEKSKTSTALSNINTYVYKLVYFVKYSSCSTTFKVTVYNNLAHIQKWPEISAQGKRTSSSNNDYDDEVAAGQIEIIC